MPQFGQSEQASQFDQVIEEISANVAKVGQSLSALAGATHKKFGDVLKEVSRVSDEVDQSRAVMNNRLRSMIGEHQAGTLKLRNFSSAESAKAFGEILIAVARRDGAKLAELNKAAVTTSTGESGGALLATTMLNEIVRNVETYGAYERSARRVPMSTLKGSLPVRRGGFTVYYPEESKELTASDPAFGSISLSLVKYAVYSLVSNEMLRYELAVPLAEFIAQEFALALAYATDLNAFVGTGTPAFARVTGLFNRTGGAAVVPGTTDVLRVTADAGDDTFAEVIAASTKYLSAMLGALPTWADATAKFYGHRSIWASYWGIRDSAGRPISSIVMDGGRPQLSLFGYPFETVQVAPKLTDSAVSKTMLLLAALDRSSIIAEQVNGMQLGMSEHVKFSSDQTAFRLTTGRDIGLVDGSAVVQLMTAAS